MPFRVTTWRSRAGVQGGEEALRTGCPHSSESPEQRRKVGDMSIRDDLIEGYLADFKAKKKTLHALVEKKAKFPIVWFGDTKAYCSGKNRYPIVTVGLNPSRKEFMARRFVQPDAKATSVRLRGMMDDYFIIRPYWSWFCHMERVLHALGASYWAGPRRAVHIDFSAIATAKGWSRLTPGQQGQLCNGNLFKALLSQLAPTLVLFSGKAGWLQGEWKTKFWSGFTSTGKRLKGKSGAELELFSRADGMQLLYGQSGARAPYGPFEQFDDDELYGAIEKWDLRK